MYETLLPAEMQALEKAWMRETGVPSILLMETAARAVADALARHAAAGAKVLFLCGPGSNGGDGYAAARIWAVRGGEAVVWELTGSAKNDAAAERFLAGQAGISLLKAASPVTALPEDCAAVVDALFGTGLSRPPQDTAAEIIRAVNASGLPVVAVDIPSGLDGADGRRLGEAIRAAETVTFHRPKPGLYLRDGCVCAGKVTVAPILIPSGWGEIAGLRVLQPDDLGALIPARPADAHKGTFGRAVIFTGSTGMAGAAALCAMACVRSGAGLTTVLCREQVLPVVQTLCPGATCRLLPERGGKLLPEAAEIAREALRTADRAAIGPGLGQANDLLPLLRVFREAACPVIWDADALNLLAVRGRAEGLLPLKAADIVTPHPGEAARLLGWETARVTEQPLEALEALHSTCGCRVILKGARTLMTDGTHQAVNAVGTPALAKGGSGDLLTGVLAGLLGRTKGALPSLGELQAAVLVHALAGIRAAGLRGEDCVCPEDVAACIRLRGQEDLMP